MVRRITPSFTVGAACIIERDDGAVLLVRQVYRRGWGMPGGLARRKEPDAATPTSPEIAEVRWFAPDELPDLQHETTGALDALGGIPQRSA